MPTADPVLVALLKSFNADEPRDDHGRWTAGSDGGTALHDATQGHDQSLREQARNLGARAVAMLHDHAKALAAKAKQIVGGTKLVGISPVQGGGIELRTASPLPRGGHVAGYLQVHPHHVHNSPALARVLAAAHGGLTWQRRKAVAMKHPNIGVTFAPGPAPT
jgi:hypothetical protein